MTIVSRGGRRIRTGLPVVLGQLLVVAVILGVWGIVTASGWISETILPGPVSVAAAVVDLVADGDFWQALVHTVSCALAGLGLAILVGLPAGLLVGASPTVESSTRIVMDIGRSFPVIALLPVLILTLGVTAQLEIFVVFLGCLWPILLLSSYGSRRTDPVVRDTVRAFLIPRSQSFFKVVLPGAAPFAATGVRIAASASVLLALAVEILARTPGLGYELMRAQVGSRADIALAYLVAAGLLGVGLNALLARAESMLLPWSARGDRRPS